MPSSQLRPDSPSILLRAPHFVERSLVVGAVLSLTGIVLVTAGILTEGVLGTILASLGTTFVTVAVLSVVYDAYLKDVLLGEIYSALSIQEHVTSLDLQRVVRKDGFNLSEFLGDATSIVAIPLDPPTWALTDWRHILDQAARKSVEITVLLPDHDSPHIDVLATRLGVARDALIQEIGQLPDKLASSWDARGDGLRHSSFKVWLYGTVPAVGVLSTDNRILLEVPPALNHPAADRSTVALSFGRRGSVPLIKELVDDQVTEERIPGFSRSVSRPLADEVSPDPPPPRRDDENTPGHPDEGDRTT